MEGCSGLMQRLADKTRECYCDVGLCTYADIVRQRSVQAGWLADVANHTTIHELPYLAHWYLSIWHIKRLHVRTQAVMRLTACAQGPKPGVKRKLANGTEASGAKR